MKMEQAMTPVLAGVEDLVPLLIFLAIWWLGSRKKRVETPAPPRQEVPPAGSGEEEPVSALDLLRQVLLGESEPFPEGRSPLPQPPAPSRSGERSGRAGREWGQAAAPLPGKRPQAALRQGVSPTQGKTARPARDAACLHGMPAQLSRRQLRQAVLWSEILAPPVGLRRNE
ncbi:MAG: hypothetical protein AB1413_01180 [Thermodesulfobacteriota bacterium]